MTAMKNVAAVTEYRSHKLMHKSQDGVALRLGGLWRHSTRKPDSNALKSTGHRWPAIVDVISPIAITIGCAQKIRIGYSRYLSFRTGDS